MKAVFIAFVITDSLLMITTAVVGALVDGDAQFALHFALGLVTTFLLCLTHCIVLTYFMATHKMIALAVEDAGLDRSTTAEASRLKFRAIMTLMPALAIGLGAAFSGGWVTNQTDTTQAHLVLAILCIAGQYAAWPVEYRLISANGALMDRTFAQHEVSQQKPPQQPSV